MESLYRKYRPLTFESVVGQQHIVSTLEHAVAEGRLSHAYLFCGPRGTGKTTMARILAKALLCQGAEAARATGASGCMACGTCPECEAIAAGTHPDVYELDAASRTGVDNVREEIIGSVNFAPVRGAYKVYIIDEVHMLTAAAFNALLKTLEEPPSHVVFVLCTTDPQKILETILSRCQRFDFHRISNEDIVGRLRWICEQEGFSYDDEALEMVARHARGGMRDALSTLEQLSVFGDGSVRVDDARSLLGEVSGTVLSAFASGIAARDVAGLFAQVRAQVEGGSDLMEFTRDAVAHVRDVYTACVAGDRSELFDGTPEEVACLVEEARLFEGPDRLARVLTVLDDAAIEMRNASDPRLVLEIALTRLARPQSDLTLEALAERLDRLEAQVAAGVASAPMDAAALTGAPSASSASRAHAASKPEPARGSAPANPAPARDRADLPWSAPRSAAAASGPAPAGVAAGAPAPAASAPVVAEPAAVEPAPAAVEPAPAATAPASPAAQCPNRPSATDSASVPCPKPSLDVEPAPAAAPPAAAASGPEVAPVPAASAPVAAAPAAPEPVASAPAAPDAGDLQRRWSDVVKRVTLAQPSRAGLLLHARAASDDGDRLVVSLPAGSGFAIKMLGRPDSHQVIDPIVREVFGPREVEYVMEGAPAPVPGAAPASGRGPAAGAGPAPRSQAPAAAPHPGGSSDAAPAPTPAPSPAPVASAAVPHPSSAPAQAAPGFDSAAAAAAPAAPADDLPWTTDPAPADGRAAQGPAAPSHVDAVSGPTVVAERDVDADRRAWEAEQVPYDDATIAAYEQDERPPLDAAPQAAPAPAPAPAAAPASAPAGAPAAPGAVPWSGRAGVESQVPQTADEAKALLGDVFGPGVVFKSADAE